MKNCNSRLFAVFFVGVLMMGELLAAEKADAISVGKRKTASEETASISKKGMKLYYKNKFHEALKCFDRMAVKGDSTSLLMLGVMNYKGQGVKKDYIKAKEYFLKAAKLNNRYAVRYLGMIYFYGKGVKIDYPKSIEYFEKAGKMGDAYSYYRLGKMHHDGTGFKKTYKKAFELCQKAAKMNERNALNEIGRYYYSGHGIAKDYQKAREYYLKAAKRNAQFANRNLGILYLYGHGVEKDYQKAREYFIKGAKRNDKTALRYLGNLYFYGWGVKQDYHRSLEYFEKAAKMNDKAALRFLGSLYYYGMGVKQDYHKSLEYFEKAADLNDIEAICFLASLYYNGGIVKQDYRKAGKYYEKAAKLNNLDACRYLGYLYSSGKGGKKDYVKAKKYFLEAAKQKDAYSLYTLGKMYFDGYDGGKAPTEASENQNNAGQHSKIKDVAASFNLIPPNLKKSREYTERALECAIASGDERVAAKAKELLRKIKKMENAFGMITGGNGLFVVYYIFLHGIFLLYQFIVIAALIYWVWQKFRRKKRAEIKHETFTVFDAIFAIELSLIIILVVSVIMVFSGFSYQNGSAVNVVIFFVSVIVTAFWLIIVKWRKWSVKKVFKLIPISNMKLIVWVVVCLLICSGFDIFYKYFCEFLGVTLSQQEIIGEIKTHASVSIWSGVAYLLIIGVVGPITEEVLFRGVILQGLSTKIPFWAASILSTIAFSIIHVEISIIIPVFVSGIILCYAFRKSGTLLAPIAIHCINNILCCIFNF